MVSAYDAIPLRAFYLLVASHLHIRLLVRMCVRCDRMMNKTVGIQRTITEGNQNMADFNKLQVLFFHN